MSPANKKERPASNCSSLNQNDNTSEKITKDLTLAQINLGIAVLRDRAISATETLASICMEQELFDCDDCKADLNEASSLIKVATNAFVNHLVKHSDKFVTRGEQ